MLAIALHTLALTGLVSLVFFLLGLCSDYLAPALEQLLAHRHGGRRHGQ